MPIVAEQAWDSWAWSYNEGLFSMSWDIDMPPSAAFFKVVMGHFTELGGSPMAQLGILNMRRRKPDNSDETVTFPSLDAFDHVYTSFDVATTHITFGMSVQNCSSSLVWSLEFWA
jgi:hypothetical protein